MNPRVLSFHYTLKNNRGETLDSSDGNEPMTFLEGSQQIIPGLEKVLVLMNIGDKRKIEVQAQDAYGNYDDGLKVSVAKTKLPNPEKVKVGDQFQAQDPAGGFTVFTVIGVADQDVELDGNHPLAGQDLVFDVEITQVREATKDEMSHGHAHGAGGHHH